MVKERFLLSSLTLKKGSFDGIEAKQVLWIDGIVCGMV